MQRNRKLGASTTKSRRPIGKHKRFALHECRESKRSATQQFPDPFPTQGALLSKMVARKHEPQNFGRMVSTTVMKDTANRIK